jgi:hypothetical protein
MRNQIISNTDTYRGDKQSKDMVLISFFGALWGLMEVTIGVTLKGLRIPFGGVLLTIGAIIIFLTGRFFINKKGAGIIIGAIAAFLKIFSLGTLIVGPVIAIIIEGAIAEGVISLFGKKRFSYMIAGGTLLLFTMLYPLFTQGIIYGANVYQIYYEIFNQVSYYLNVEKGHLLYILAGYGLIHFVIGVSAGLIGWRLTQRVKIKLGLINIKRELRG